MTYDQLPKNPRVGVMLRCHWCMVEGSACRSDYFHSLPDTPECPECRGPMLLVQKRVRYVRVSPAKAEAGP